MPENGEIIPFVIGITGMSGSGKSWLVHKLANVYRESLAIVKFDDYYKPFSEQVADNKGILNFDLPDALYQNQFQEDLLKLIEGHPILVKEYQFELDNPEEITLIVSAAPIIIADGLFILHHPGINNLLNARVFIESDNEITLQRRLKRDAEERGIPEERSLYQWHNHVLPAYNEYILPYKSICDLAIQNSDEEAIQLEKIHQLIIQNAHPSVVQKLQR